MSQVPGVLYNFTEMHECELPEAVWHSVQQVGDQQYQLPRRPVFEATKEQQQSGHRREDLTAG